MYRVAFVGNPNVGKTSLYNGITKSSCKVGNWHGVTVSAVKKVAEYGVDKVEYTDLPGIYSLKPFSADEQIAVQQLDSGFDLIVYVVNVEQLQRNLYLLLEILKKYPNTIVALNFSDRLKKGKTVLDIDKLQSILGVQCILTNTLNKKGTTNLVKCILQYKNCYNCVKGNNIVDKIDTQTDSQVGYQIQQIASQVVLRQNSDKLGLLDKIVLNPYLAIPIFFLVMGFVFFVVFSLVGNYSANFIDNILTKKIDDYMFLSLHNHGVNEWIIAFVCGCLIGGVFGFVKFLPTIVALYFFMTVLEDSGYISRVAFLTDEFFAKFGLSGRSVFTILLGFGCNTTALCTARNVENRTIQKKVLLISPFVPCSARLPVFVLIAGTLFDNSALIIFALYIVSIFVTIVLASILQSIKGLKTTNPTVIMELPNYQMPRPRRLLQIIGSNTRAFFVRVFGIGITLNIIIWVLSNFTVSFAYVPQTGGISILQMIGEFVAVLFRPLGFGNWRAMVALIGGVIAKEIVLTSIASLGGVALVIGSSKVVAFAFLLFVLLYTPCISTMAEMAKEIGKKYMWLSIALNNVIAYLVALYFVGISKVYTVNHMLSVVLVVATVVGLIVLPKIICNFGKRVQRNPKRLYNQTK